MKAVATVVLALLVLGFAAPALATYGAGSNLEADAPIVLQGRTDALLPQGVASFVSADDGPSLLASLTASELNVTSQIVPASCGPSSPTDLTAPTCATTTGTTVTATVTNAQLTLVRVLSAYKLVVTNKDQYRRSSSFGAPGSLVASSGANTLLGATTKAIHLAPSDADWTDASERPAGDLVYAVDPGVSDASSSSGSLHALGGFQAMFQGVEVRVVGTDKSDGQPFTGDYRVQSVNGDVEYLVVEATGGDLKATSDAPLTGYWPTTVDVRGGAAMQHATGRVVVDGSSSSYDSQDAIVSGPVSLALTHVTLPSGNTPARIAFALSSDLRVADLAASPPPPQRSTGQLVAAGAAGAGAAALLAGLVYFWPRLRFAGTLLFLPLYTRIERTAVLDHEKRDEIYELIRASPGIHAHEIGERANIGWGTTVYHLKLLENHSLVVSKKSGRYKRFFVNTGEYTKKKDVYGALRNDTAKAVADFVVNHPGCNQKELCAALGIQPSLASWHVEKLESVELVKRVKDGRMVRYFAGPAWSDLNVRISPTGGADTPAET
jgi:DNA-binding transcriptional ArsR family regulator